MGREIEWARTAERKQHLVIFVTKSLSGLTILDYIYTKNILPFLKFKPYWQTQFHYCHWNLWWLLPTSAVWTVLNDLILFDYSTIDSSYELQRAAEHLIDSTKKTFVCWVMNFTVHMLLKGAVTYCDQHFMSNFSLFYFIFILPHMVIMCYRKTANNITVYASKVFLCRMIFQTHWN